jgi:predicted nuclease of predicted toxin-antitoxin system
MKFVIDMNLSPQWVGFLSAHGFEAIHWSAVGAPDAPDRDVMHWAARQGCVVMTSDLGFAAILASTQDSRPSVVLIRGDVLGPDVVGPAVLAGVRQAGDDLESGAVLSVDVNRSRLRVLPLTPER